MNINMLIESDAIINHQVNDLFGGMIAMDKKDHTDMHSKDLISFFQRNPEGETDKYQWYTSRVDELVNLHIFRMKK